MTRAAFRRWIWVHKWSSLVCTIFLLMLCVTGLPLVFLHEINEAYTPSRDATSVLPADTRPISVDRLIAISRDRFPGQLVTAIFVDDDEPHAFVSMAPSFGELEANPRLGHWLKFDIRTADVINTSEQFSKDMKAAGRSLIGGVMGMMVRLHIDLYARLPGQLLLGFMGLLFVVAIVSGAVLYSPFMKKHAFGTVRADQSRRLKWFDLHNLLGVVTLAWMTVVGLTGALNELAVPLNNLWRAGVQTELGIAVHGGMLPDQSEMASAQGAFDAVRRAMPGMVVQSLVFPSPKGISINHYTIVAKGDTPLTARMNTAALVDVRTGEVTKILEMPWYLKALQLSRPLHFGDYGGLPLKIIWALLDIVTIIVLGSGLYLWWARRSSISERIEVGLLESNAYIARRPHREAAE